MSKNLTTLPHATQLIAQARLEDETLQRLAVASRAYKRAKEQGLLPAAVEGAAFVEIVRFVFGPGSFVVEDAHRDTMQAQMEQERRRGDAHRPAGLASRDARQDPPRVPDGPVAPHQESPPTSGQLANLRDLARELGETLPPPRTYREAGDLIAKLTGRRVERGRLDGNRRGFDASDPPREAR